MTLHDVTVLYSNIRHSAASSGMDGTLYPRSILVLHGLRDDDEGYIRTLISQIEDPLGAAVTLSELLSTNEKLIRTFVDDDLLEVYTLQTESW